MRRTIRGGWRKSGAAGDAHGAPHAANKFSRLSWGAVSARIVLSFRTGLPGAVAADSRFATANPIVPRESGPFLFRTLVAGCTRTVRTSPPIFPTGSPRAAPDKHGEAFCWPGKNSPKHAGPERMRQRNMNGSISPGICAGIAIVALSTIGCCIWWPHPPHQGPKSPVVPKRELVEDLRVLWSFERNYAYFNKGFATSIGELGDGTGIGMNGFVRKISIWEARLDAAEGGRPASYRITNPTTGNKQTIGAYRFGLHPVLSETGERDRFSAVLVSVPETAFEQDSCFVALCGPVDLRNDFSFDRDWPVYELSASSNVVEALRTLPATTFSELERRIASGDLSKYRTGFFRGLAYPEPEPQNP